MPMYHINDLMDMLKGLKQQGYEYIGISEDKVKGVGIYSIRSGEGVKYASQLKASDYYYL